MPLTAFTGFFTAVLAGITVFIQSIITFFTTFGTTLVTLFKTTLTTLQTALTTAWTTISTGVQTAWNGIVSWLKGAATNIINAIETPFKTAISAVQSLWTGLQSSVTSAINSIKSSISSVATAITGVSVPGHAAGGANLPAGWSVIGEEGPELMYVPGGSTILPNSSYNALNTPSSSSSSIGGNVTITVNAPQRTQNEAKTIATAVSKELASRYRLQLGTISTGGSNI